MKKGEKLLEKAYLLQVKDLRNKTVGGGVCRSLRQAVTVAADFVEDMDTYSKVYREFTTMRGAYAGAFFSKHKTSRKMLAAVGRQPSKHLFVLINEAEIESSEIQADIHQGPPEGFLGELGELMAQ